MYTVASPDPSPRDGGQLPNPNKCNSTLTSGTRGEILTLTSGTSGSAAPTYIYTQFCRIKGCGGAGCPPPIIWKDLSYPNKLYIVGKGIYRRVRIIKNIEKIF